MALPTYTPNVPQGSQQINNTQQPINTNFQDIYDLIAVNHVPFNTADDYGKHNFISYCFQDSDPSTGSAEMAVYSKIVNDSNAAELFYRYPDNGTIVQLTGLSTGGSSTGEGSGATYPSGTTTDGQSYYAGSWQKTQYGIIIMTGYIYVSSPTFTVTIPSGGSIPQMSTIFNVVCGTQAPSQSSYTGTPNLYTVNIISNTQFTIYMGSGETTNSVTWTLIGV